jgi:hypothetical protein
MILAPVGIINERHEPRRFTASSGRLSTPSFPTTWFDAGAGVHGAFGAVGGIAPTHGPLDATRSPPRRGWPRRARRVSVERLQHRADRAPEYGVRGLVLGTSFWQGRADSISAAKMRVSASSN